MTDPWTPASGQRVRLVPAMQREPIGGGKVLLVHAPNGYGVQVAEVLWDGADRVVKVDVSNLVPEGAGASVDGWRERS